MVSLRYFYILILAYATVSAQKIQNFDSQYRVPGEYHVVLHSVVKVDKEKYATDAASKILSLSEKLTVPRKFIFNKLIVLVVHTQDEAAVNLIFGLPEVKEIEANLKQPGVSQNCVSQSSGSFLWGLSRIASRQLPNFNGAMYTYEGGDGTGTYAYVVDSGINIAHQDYSGRATRGYTAQNLMASEGEQDLNGHGTHCTGTIMSNTYGVAKFANAIAVKIISADGFYTGTDFLDGVNWMYQDFVAKVNAQGNNYKAVASMSLGGGGSSTNDAAVQDCIDAGLTVAVAAMNNNNNACNYSPARMDDAITVGATDDTDTLASFSNWGTCVNILGPGVDIVSTFIGSNTATAVYSGTSMATPHVAGVLLRYMSQLGYRPSPAAARQALYDYGTKNVCDLRGHTTTPNNLLFADCNLAKKEEPVPVPINVFKKLSQLRRGPIGADYQPGQYDQPDRPAGGHTYKEWLDMKYQVRVTYNLAIAIIALLAATLLVSLSGCCIRASEAESVTAARQRWYFSNMAQATNTKTESHA